MKIFLVSNMFPSDKQPYYASFIKAFYDGLTEKGHNLEIKALIKGRKKNKFVKVLNYLKFYFEIFYKGIFFKYDVIYVHYLSQTAIPLLLLRILKPYKLILNPHGQDIIAIYPFEMKMLRFVQKLMNYSILVVTPSHFFKNYILKNFDIDDEKIFVSASAGVSPEFFKNDKIMKLDDYKIFQIGFVSRIDSGKGWDILVKSINEIKKGNLILNFKCTIVGYGNEVNNLNNLISEYNLQNIINYIGSKTNDELTKVYLDFDVFVFSTELTESLGLVGLEAMASGVPVIGSFLGGITDYLIDGYNGYAFNSGNVQDLTAKICKFYNLDKSLQNTMSNNARLTAISYKNSVVIDDLSNKLNLIFHK